MARTDLLWMFVMAMLEAQQGQVRFRLPTPREPEAPRTAVPRVPLSGGGPFPHPLPRPHLAAEPCEVTHTHLSISWLLFPQVPAWFLPGEGRGWLFIHSPEPLSPQAAQLNLCQALSE